MKITSFVTPISKENQKRDNSLLSQLDEGAMKYQALERDAVGLDARTKGDVFKPTELENNIEVYDVEVAAYGNFKGHGMSLAFLLSKSTGKPIKGYPVTVEIMEDSCPAPSTEVPGRAISHIGCLMESRISVPRQARSLRNPVVAERYQIMIWISPGDEVRGTSHPTLICEGNILERDQIGRLKLQKIRRCQFARPTNQHLQQGKWVASHPFQIVRERMPTGGPLIVKGFPQSSHSAPVDDSENNTDEFHSDNGADEYQSDSSTDEYQSDSSTDDYMKLATYFASSRGSPLFSSPAATSSRSLNGSTALYLCSASTMCAPVRLFKGKSWAY